MLKLSRNRKAARPTITVSSLRRQPAELQADRAGSIFSDEAAPIDKTQQQPSMSRGRPSKKNP